MIPAPSWDRRSAGPYRRRPTSRIRPVSSHRYIRSRITDFDAPASRMGMQVSTGLELAIRVVSMLLRLRERLEVHIVKIAQQRLLDRRDTVQCFGQGAREILEATEAVELRLIVIAAVLSPPRHARPDLGFRFDLYLAHLAAQPGDAGRQLQVIAFDPPH